MLFHNVFAMSSTTNTPTRPARGIPVPGIDTRGPADKAASSLSFSGWPLTPPQSANESRRPSLAYSALSDASHSGPSSVSGYSQPATPVHGMSNRNDFTHQWSDGTDVHASMSASLADNCSAGPVPQHGFASAFQQLSMCNPNVPNGLPATYSTEHNNAGSFGMDMSPESPMHDAWSQQQMSSGFNGHSGLRTTLFQSTQGLGHDQSSSASMYANPAQSIHTSLGASVFPNYDTAGPILNNNVYQTPQVVVPSQLSPHEDYSMDQYSGYDAQEVEDGFTQSFDSSGSGYSSWDHVEPPSPYDAHVEKTEDDYMMIKNEFMTPSRQPSRNRGFFDSGPSQVRPRRKGSKLGRKANNEDKCWYKNEFGNIQVGCVGKKFSRYQCPDGSIQYLTEEHKESKPHRCTHEDEDGNRCSGRFARSEHLKRHMSKHATERPYPCPLVGCSKRISRPDNAADHFRTHLRAHSKGKRNKHCEFDELKNRINDEYDAKTATKLINNLSKWWKGEEERQKTAEQNGLKALEREAAFKAPFYH